MTKDQNKFTESDLYSITQLARFRYLGEEVAMQVMTPEEMFCVGAIQLKYIDLKLEIKDKGVFYFNGKIGIVSNEGFAFPIYDDVGYFKEGLAVVRRADGKCNHINTKGELLSDEWWKWAWNFNEDFAGVMRADGKINHINTKGELLSEEWWENACIFYKGFAKVERVDGTNGWIDKKGIFMTNSQTEYSDYEYNALGYFLKQQMFGVELSEQEQIEAAMAILKFGEIEIPEVEDDMQPIEINKKWGVISKNGWIAFPIYSWTWNFQEGFAEVQRADEKYNHINTKGEFLSNEWWDWAGDFNEGFAWVRRADGTYNHINTKGDFLSEEWWYWAWDFYKGFARVERVDGQEGYIDKQGKFYDKRPK